MLMKNHGSSQHISSNTFTANAWCEPLGNPKSLLFSHCGTLQLLRLLYLCRVLGYVPHLVVYDEMGLLILISIACDCRELDFEQSLPLRPSLRGGQHVQPPMVP